MIDGIAVLVLAAGEGRRLRPLTGILPKPLLPVAGRPLLEYTLGRLERLGVTSVVLNAHHLADRLVDGLAYRRGRLQISYSHEPELLGTLGALGPLRERFRGAREIVVLNGDTLCRWPLKALVACHRRWGAAATLLLTSEPDPTLYGGGVGTDGDGRVLAIRSVRPAPEEITRRRVFAGAHVLDGRLLDRVPAAGPADVVTGLWEPLLAEGEIIASICRGRAWHDLGTPQRYLDGVIDWSRRRGPIPRPWRGWTHPEVRVASGARVRGTVLETGATVEVGARLERCAVLAGATIGAGARLTDVVVGFGATVPAGTTITGHLVTRPQAGLEVPTTSSRVGDLVLTALSPFTGGKRGELRR